MSAQQPSSGQTTPLSGLSLLLATGLMGWLAVQSGPLIEYGQINYVAGFFAFFALVGTIKLIAAFILRLARFTEWYSTHKASGRSGTAHWATWAQLKREVGRKAVGPFWGLIAKGKVGGRGKPLFIDFASNAMCIAPAGSGKGIYTAVPNGFSIKDSTFWTSFKGESECILKDALEKDGQRVYTLNPGGLWGEHLGPSERYNPLDIIAASLWRAGGLRDVPDDLRELTHQLLPEPANGKGDDAYFREGSRRAMADAILIEVMMEGFEATLASVALLIESREKLEESLAWIVGVDAQGKPDPGGRMPIEGSAFAPFHDPEDIHAFAELVRARAANLLSLMKAGESRTFESFISGAQQAIAPFAFGRLAHVMGKSTFSMDELKDGPTAVNVFVVADASRMEAYKPYLGLMQWAAMTAIKRHPNKERPVYFMADECTNYRIHGLESLLTWGRGYGLRLFLIFQDLGAFENCYGRTATETLLSETEIKQFLPGQRSPKTLELISKLLGEQSVMGAGLSRNKEGLSAHMSESARRLLTPDEIRRTPYGLLFVRRQPAALLDPISYAEVSPWRKRAGLNPFFGKPFLKKVRLKLKR